MSRIDGMLLGGTVSKSPKSLNLSIDILPGGKFSIPHNISVLGFKLSLVAYSKSSTGVYTLSYTSSIKPSRFTTGKIYKVVPVALFDAYSMTCQLSRIYPPSLPEDTTIRVKLSNDPYGADGFLLSEILEDLGLRVELAPIFDYSIVEFAVRKGASKEQIVRDLLALPIVINYTSDDTFEVNPHSAFSFLPGSCENETFEVKDVQRFEYFTTGLLGEPVKVVSSGNCDNKNVTYLYNRFGSIYGILEEKWSSDVSIKPYHSEEKSGT